ncbi:hypothetical protein IF2G_06077 [Cordyceps javanica]|nr:hypothetical protein IF2G_06077 [Cordyceps javanica]
MKTSPLPISLSYALCHGPSCAISHSWAVTFRFFSGAHSPSQHAAESGWNRRAIAGPARDTYLDEYFTRL